jgi:GT2 family glycosyltransferase
MASQLDIIVASFGDPNESPNHLRLCLHTVHAFTDISHRVLLERSSASASVNRNRALARVEAPYVCFLDDDAWVTPYWSARLIEVLESSPEIGMVGPKLKLGDGRLFCFGIARTGVGEFQPFAYNAIDDGRYCGLAEPFALPSTCLMVKRAAVLAAGSFDERYSACQWEDLDYYLRLRLAGFRGLVNGAATVYHRHMFRSNAYELNRAIFVETWAKVLSKAFPPAAHNGWGDKSDHSARKRGE